MERNGKREMKMHREKKSLTGLEKRDAYLREVLAAMEDMLGGDDSLTPWSAVPISAIDGWVGFKMFSDFEPEKPAYEAAQDLIYNDSFDPRAPLEE